MSLSGHFKDKQQWKLKTKERRDISKEEDAEREKQVKASTLWPLLATWT